MFACWLPSTGVSMGRRIFYFSLLSLSLAACSSFETRKQAQGDFDYVDSANDKQSTVIVIPENLTKPVSHDKYFVPNVDHANDPVGKKVDVRAPALVLPTASGSRIDEFDKTAEVWYDKVDDKRDLREQVILAIKGHMTDQDVELLNENLENNTWESSWFNKETETGSLFWKSIESTESWRFKYSLVTKPHGRSIGLNVELVDYKFTTEDVNKTEIDSIEKSRVEMGMINAITGQLGYQYRVNNRQDRIARANMEIVSYGRSAKDKPALIIDYPADELWTYMPGFFDKYGFVITDLNEDKLIYTVSYEKPDSSIWDRMWGDDVPVINIESATYDMHLQKLEKKTALVITNEQGEVLSEDAILDNFEVLEEALSFRE